MQAHELAALLQGHTDVVSGEAWLRPLVQLAPERVLHEALAREQTELRGRNRYERRGPSSGSRNADEEGTLQTADGVLRGTLPQRRGGEEPPRSPRWAPRAQPRERLPPLIVEMVVGGRSQRALEAALEKSLGPFVPSTSSMNTMTDTLRQEEEALRTRDLSGYDVASLCIDRVSAP